jgi:S1-C subfamily serine protease
MPRHCVLLAAFVVVSLPLSALALEKPIRRTEWRKLIGKLEPALVFIRGKGPKPGTFGLGAVVSKEGVVVLPLRHVAGFKAVEARLPNGRKCAARLLGTVPGLQLAVVKITAPGPLPFIEYGDTTKLRLADALLSLEAWGGDNFKLAAEIGVFTGTSDGLFQMDSARSAPRGNGLLFDSRGGLAGIWTKFGAVQSERIKKAVRRLVK